MQFVSFASGSSGNCSLISCGGTNLMIDAGISNKKIEARLEQAGLSASELDGICITHEHIDHIAGLRVFLKRHPMKVYATAGTAAGIRRRFGDEVDPELFVTVRAGESFSAGDFTVTPFATEHDAAEPCSFRIRGGGKTFAVATDLGNWSSYTARWLSDLDFLMLEANHDVRMLETGPYPYPLKQRILSDLGHLSNEDSGRLFTEVLNPKLASLLLCHLSKENNYPGLAKEAVRFEAVSAGAAPAKDLPRIDTAPRDGMSDIYEI